MDDHAMPVETPAQVGDDVPESLARLWRVSAVSHRGRPSVLDVDLVVGKAVELADRAGLAGVTLPKLAAALGVTPMSLYRHVGSKGELLELMRDLAGGPAPAVDNKLDPGDWREGLRRWAVAQRIVFGRHPWLAELPVSGPPAGPNAVGWIDSCLRALRATGLSSGSKLAVVSLVGGFVRSASVTWQQLAEGRRHLGVEQAAAEQAYGRALALLIDPARFPEAAALFGSSPFTEGDLPREAGSVSDGAADEHGDLSSRWQLESDPDFSFGLQVILDGVAALVTDVSSQLARA